MKILFWFNGSGGQRRERKVVTVETMVDGITEPVTKENLQKFIPHIEDALDEWKYSLRSSSEYQRWGWDENFDPVKLEPLSKA